MSVAADEQLTRRDPYRFGSGPTPVLQPGTLGWSVDDLNDPATRFLWDEGRYEIIEGVLATSPPSTFRHGNAMFNLQFCLREHFRANRIKSRSTSAVEITINSLRVLRADGAMIAASDLERFRRQRSDWEDHALALPPTLIIESVSRGHEAHDRVTKRRWYAEFQVPNYWVIDGAGRTLECLRLNGDHYEVDAAGRQDETVAPSSFPGLRIPLKQVWEA